MAAASGDRPIQSDLGSPNDFNDFYRPPSLKSCRLLQSRPPKPTSRFRRIQVCPKDLSIRLVAVCEGGGPIALLRQGEFTMSEQAVVERRGWASDIMWFALYSILVLLAMLLWI